MRKQEGRSRKKKIIRKKNKEKRWKGGVEEELK